MPLDGVLALIEGAPITSAQVAARLGLMRALAQNSPSGPDQPLTAAQAYKELFEARLLSWDAERMSVSVSDAEVDRMMELIAGRAAPGAGKQTLSAALASYGIDEAAYRELCSQQILFAKLDRIGTPVRTRAERLRALEAQAQILNVNELLSQAPSEKRVCTPASARPVQSPDKSAIPIVAGLCLEGERSAQTDARLAELGRSVLVGGALDRAGVARAQARLLSMDDAAEAAAVYAISTQPREPPENARSLWVIFRVRERPWFAGLDLVGMPAGVHVDLPPAEPKTRVSQRALRVQLDQARDKLRDAGFRSASLKLERVPAAAGTGPAGAPSERVRMLVTPGPRTRIAQVEFTGVSDARRAELRALLPFRPADAYEEVECVAARFTLEHDYRERGYLSARVEVPEATDMPAAPDGSPQVRLRYAVQEGPQTRLAALRLTGALPLAEAALRRLVKSALGKPVSPDTLRADVQRMQEAAKASGKPVEITPNIDMRSEGTQVDVTLQFAPAPASTGLEPPTPR